MDIDRRTLIGGGLCLAGVSASAACGEPVSDEQRGRSGNSVGVSDQLAGGIYPSAERFRLWPGRPPGAPATLPVLRTGAKATVMVPSAWTACRPASVASRLREPAWH